MPGEPSDVEKGLGACNANPEIGSSPKHFELDRAHQRERQSIANVMESASYPRENLRNGSSSSQTGTSRDLEVEPVTGKILEYAPSSPSSDEPDTYTAGEWAILHHKEGLLVKIAEPPEFGVWQPFHLVTQWLSRYTLSNLPRSSSVSERSSETEDSLESSPEHRRFRISLAEMHRMHLRKLQIRLAKHAVDMHITGAESEDWEEDLAKYTQGLRDADYILENGSRHRDYFLITGERSVDNHIIKGVMWGIDGRNPDRSLWENLKEESQIEPLQTKPTPISDTRSNMSELVAKQGLRNRVLLGLVGGALLIGPMWLMVLHNDIWTGLGTTTACVLAFVVVTSLRLDKPMEVLSATAAYAAVLVVFVGLTTTTGS